MPNDDLDEKLRAFAEAQGMTLDELKARIGDSRRTTLVGGDATAGRDLVMGDSNTTNITNIHQGIYKGPDPGDDDSRRRTYLDVLTRRCASIPLSGLERRADDAGSAYQALSLDQVYIDLDTTSVVPKSGDKDTGEPGREETRPLTAVEAVFARHRSVLLGDPGSGKSTFVNRLCLAFANADWENLPAVPAPCRACLPVLLILRDFTRWLTAQGATVGDATLLRKFLNHELTRRNLPFMTPLVDRALAQAQGAMVFLDGLDEVPPEHRQTVLAVVRDFAEQYPHARMLITCRVVTYERQEWRLPETQFESFRLAPFDREKIERFVSLWYEEMGRRWNDGSDRHQQLAAQLTDALRRPDLAEFAANPLLLTVMSLVHTQDKVLPEHRAVLYERTVDILLWRWEATKHEGEPALLQQLRVAGRSEADLLRVLRQQAFEAHRQAVGSDRVAGIDADKLVMALIRLHPETDFKWAEELVDLMRQRTGLLVEREPGVFAFPHRTFQEYLAATELALDERYEHRAVELASDGDYWREVILLSVGYWVHVVGRIGLPRVVVEDLCPRCEPADDAGWRLVRLAGEALLEMGVSRLADLGDAGERLKGRVLELLTALVEGGHLVAKERVHAGEVLGRLGDPRFDAKRLFLPCRFRGERERQIGLVEIPAGEFYLGEEGDHPGPLTMPYRYWMARYPVTVAQYGAFVDDGGYRDESWWQTDHARKWLRPGATCPNAWEVQRLHPNRPVTRVCWFEATAYCAWLTARLGSKMPKGYVFRLPTEAEWEKAARGGRKVEYPWGDESIDEERANYGVNIGDPSPVGVYPAGATPTGLLDLAGNVWEWTLSVYADYPYKDEVNIPSGDNSRVLRGGSWNNVRQAARCAVRGDGSPGYRLVYSGFRVVVSLAVES